MKQKFDITGMSCAACSAHVEKAVRKLEGIRSADVSLMTNSMTADFDENLLSAETIIQAVKAAGYGASLPARAGAKAEERRPDDVLQQELTGMKRRFVWSLVFLLPLFYLSMGHMMGLPIPAFLSGHENMGAYALTQLLLTLPILYINDKYYKGGFKALFGGAPNMDSLVAIGSACSFAYSVVMTFLISDDPHAYVHNLYYESAAVVLTLVSLGTCRRPRAPSRH